MQKLWYSLIAMAFAVVICGGFFSGVKIGCDGPPLKEGATVVMGQPCPPEAPTPEKVIVYQTITREVHQPIIGLETVKYGSLILIPGSLIVIGSVLMIKALWAAKWWG